MLWTRPQLSGFSLRNAEWHRGAVSTYGATRVAPKMAAADIKRSVCVSANVLIVVMNWWPLGSINAVKARPSGDRFRKSRQRAFTHTQGVAPPPSTIFMQMKEHRLTPTFSNWGEWTTSTWPPHHSRDLTGAEWLRDFCDRKGTSHLARNLNF